MSSQLLRRTVAVALALAASAAQATTYYVRTDGNDVNAGLENTAAGALATVQAAASRTVPGDVVLVEAGDYAENVSIGLGNAGQPGLPITYRAEGPVRLGSFTFAQAPGFSSSATYHVTLDGFAFDGTLTGAANGIWMAGATNIEILNCSFRNYRAVDPAWGGNAGIAFYNNAWSASAYGTVRNALFENNDLGAWSPGSGMLNSSLFEDCTFVRNGVGYSSSNWGDRYLTFSRCTFDGNGYGVILEGVYWYWLKTSNNTLQRCIFSNNGVGLVFGDLAHSTHDGVSYANTVVNGDFYVVGPVTIKAITPKPLYGAEIPDIGMDVPAMEAGFASMCRCSSSLWPRSRNASNSWTTSKKACCISGAGSTTSSSCCPCCCRSSWRSWPPGRASACRSTRRSSRVRRRGSTLPSASCPISWRSSSPSRACCS